VEHVEAKWLLAILDWFLPLDTELIPNKSILREFIGGSILHDFMPWQPLSTVSSIRAIPQSVMSDRL